MAIPDIFQTFFSGIEFRSTQIGYSRHIPDSFVGNRWNKRAEMVIPDSIQTFLFGLPCLAWSCKMR